MNFQTFCGMMATEQPLNVDPTQIELPSRYERAVDSMIAIMKPKKNIFEKINVPFIESIFSNIDWVSQLDKTLVDGEIPDSMIRKLSEGIYDKPVSELDDKQTEIIKILSVYICIQN